MLVFLHSIARRSSGRPSAVVQAGGYLFHLERYELLFKDCQPALYRSAALFCHIENRDGGQVGFVLVGVVFLCLDEHNNVAILLQTSTIAQVRKSWPPAALLKVPAHLGSADNRAVIDARQDFQVV